MSDAYACSVCLRTHPPSALWPSGKPDRTTDAAVKGNQQDIYWMGMDATLSVDNVATHGMCNRHKSTHAVCTVSIASHGCQCCMVVCVLLGDLMWQDVRWRTVRDCNSVGSQLGTWLCTAEVQQDIVTLTYGCTSVGASCTCCFYLRPLLASMM